LKIVKLSLLIESFEKQMTYHKLYFGLRNFSQFHLIINLILCFLKN